MEKTVLKNGLNVIFKPMMNTHSITVGLYIRTGEGYGTNKPGLPHMLEHMHFRELFPLTQEELYYTMESIGSTLRASTYRDFISFTMKILPKFLFTCADVFEKLICSCSWSEDSINKERKVVLNQITEDDSFYSIDDDVRRIIFGDHPLSRSIMGSKEAVESISAEDLLLYKKTVFNTSNLLLCITGCFEELDKIRILEKFGSLAISPGSDDNHITLPNTFGVRGPDVCLLMTGDDCIDVNLSFDLLYEKSDALYYAILNCIIGEGVGSRLQRLVREELCYTANISSTIEWYEDFAVLHISYSVSRDHFMHCLQAIISILLDVSNLITSRDLEVSLPFYMDNIVFIEDDTEEMNFRLGYYNFILNNLYDVEMPNDNAKIANILQDFSKQLFQHENCCFVAVGDLRGVSENEVRQLLKKL